jgi:hypothetical protein
MRRRAALTAAVGHPDPKKKQSLSDDFVDCKFCQWQGQR